MDENNEVSFEIPLAPGDVRWACVREVEQHTRFITSEQFADITLRIEPNVEGEEFVFVFDVDLEEASWSRADMAMFIAAVGFGVRDWALNRAEQGRPVVRTRVSLLKMLAHEVNSRLDVVFDCGPHRAR